MTELTEDQITEIFARDWQRRIAVRDVGVAAERRRCVGVVLRVIGEQRLRGNTVVVDVLEQLATRLEHPENER